MNDPNQLPAVDVDRPRRWSTGRVAAAAVVGAIGAIVTVFVGTGALVGQCWHGCGGTEIAIAVLIAVGLAALAAGVTIAGVLTARQGWRSFAIWCAGIVVLVIVGKLFGLIP